MNICGISGNLVRTPELKSTQSGKYVCSFTIAVSRPYSKDKTDFIDCVAWDSKAEFVSKYFQKGSRIEVSGIITTRDYEKDGSKRKVTEILCDYVNFGGSKKDSGESKEHKEATVSEEDFKEIPDYDDLPF